jgi:hypothetical protein
MVGRGMPRPVQLGGAIAGIIIGSEDRMRSPVQLAQDVGCRRPKTLGWLTRRTVLKDRPANCNQAEENRQLRLRGLERLLREASDGAGELAGRR